MISIILDSVARIVLPPALLIAIYLLLRGHYYPGGGFIAALVTAAVFVLQFVASGRGQAAPRLPVHPDVLIAGGLLVAAFTGLGAQLVGYPFLTSAYGGIDVPALGRFEASTAALFDVGVYLVVTGITLRILLGIEE